MSILPFLLQDALDRGTEEACVRTALSVAGLLEYMNRIEEAIEWDKKVRGNEVFCIRYK